MKRFALIASGAVLASAKPNPIRKVVALLQEMAGEITAEVAKEKKMFEKFQCYCKKNDGDLDAKAKAAAELIKATSAEVESNIAHKKQLTEEVKKHKADRKNAEKSLDEATKKRQEEKGKYDEATKDQKQTISDISHAIAALEKGMGRSFLQTGASAYLSRVLGSNASAVDGLTVSEKETLSSFLQNKKDYSAQGGEIVGILKMMKQNFDDSLGGIISEEEAAVAAYNKLKATLQDLIKTSGRSIEKKNELKGETAVKIVEGKNKVATTEKQMGDDMATLAQLKEACGGRGDEFKVRQADAAAEVDAINQAIGVLNNDDALQLFNKTDTKALNQVSLLQSRAQTNSPAAAVSSILSQRYQLPAIAMLAFAAKQALKSGAKKVDFSKVMKMVDDMVVLLKKEAEDDLTARDSCNKSFTESAATKKETEHSISGLEAKIEELAGAIEAQAAIIKKAEADVAAAQQAEAEATEQRKQENEDFVVAVDLNNQAVALIQKAKNKLQAFYNPQLYKADVPPEMSAEDKIVAGAQTVFAQDLPEGSPDMWAAGDRKSKGKKSNSVMALMDMLAGDLNKDTTAMVHDEDIAQKDYERLSSDLATQIVESTKAKAEATTSKSNAEDGKLTSESTLSMKNQELADVTQTIADLHAQCDFILGAFEERKSARETEISGLTKAKAILAGAKFD